ncbi:MAG: flavodoxin [Firmicutes bacterium ADurb.Bin506]|nr:MAG: flavodoxin [Firmicutes bacterium ADurb.Bin506]
MAKTAVVYHTETGNSQKIANAIASELGISAYNIATDPELRDIDLLFVVGGIYGGKSHPKLIEYMGRLDNTMVRRAAIITSCASGKRRQLQLRQLLTDKGIKVLPDEFVCKARFLFLRLGRPNKNDIDNIVAFAKAAM